MLSKEKQNEKFEWLSHIGGVFNDVTYVTNIPQVISNFISCLTFRVVNVSHSGDVLKLAF